MVVEIPGGTAFAAAPGRSSSADAAAIARGLTLAHQEKLRFCDLLEEIADRLPGDVDRFKCLTAGNALAPLIGSIHRFEEDTVFPAYAFACGDAGCSATIGRLRAEHVADECFADEVTEALLSLGHGAPVQNAEALGFMLRGFFESVRRHVAFEDEHVLPALLPAGDGI